jgi:hypothetical protein
MKEAMENEIKQFLETGEVTLGFKDDELYKRVEELERLNPINERLLKVEKFVNKYKDHLLAIENILNRLIEQTSVEKADASTQEDIIQEPLENDEPPIVYSIMIPVLIIVISFLYAIYADRKSFAELELRFNNNSFGNKLMM